MASLIGTAPLLRRARADPRRHRRRAEARHARGRGYRVHHRRRRRLRTARHRHRAHRPSPRHQRPLAHGYPRRRDARHALARRRLDSPRRLRAAGEGGDRYQMHSKALAVTGPGSWFTGFVGSANWTFTALEGVNLEATVEVRCDADDRFAADLRAHVDACIAESDPFDPSQVDAYLAIQRALMPAGPRDPDDEDLDDFDRFPAVVIARGGSGGPGRASGSAPLRRAGRRNLRRVHLRPPRGALSLSGGSAVWTGAADGRAELFRRRYHAGEHQGRRARAGEEGRLRDPRPGRAADPERRGVSGRPVRVARGGDAPREQGPPRAVRLSHGNGQKPSVRDRIQFDREPIAGLPGLDRAAARRYLHAPRFDRDEQLLRMTPVGIRREVTVSVPSPELYPEHPEIVLKERFDRPLRQFGVYRRDVVEGSLKRDEGRQFVVRHAPQNGGRYVFVATHRSKRWTADFGLQTADWNRPKSVVRRLKSVFKHTAPRTCRCRWSVAARRRQVAATHRWASR